ncbi:MAG: hypothetical protein ACOCZJ_00285 [Thermoplasmatota archaeon]
MGKVKKSITFILALIIILSGSAFIFTETVEGSVYSDDDSVSADIELQYTRDYTFDLSFYSGDNDTGGGWTPPGSTSIGMTSTNDHYAEQVWRKSGIKVECGGIKEVSCHLDIDLRTGGYYSFKITPEGYAYQFEIEQTKDLSSNTVGITIDESYGPDSSLTCEPYNFFFEDNTWRVKVVSEDSDEYDDRIKVNSAELTITTCSSPGMTDTDGDGYDDGEEINNYGSSPVNIDTDGDGWYDGPNNEIVKLELVEIRRIYSASYSNLVYITTEDERRYPGYDDEWTIDKEYTHGYQGIKIFKEYEFQHGIVVDKRVVTENNDEFHTDIDLFVNTGSYSIIEENNFANDFIALDWNAYSTDYNLNFYEENYDGERITEYELEFEVSYEHFSDPSPNNADGDHDNDGLTDEEEYQMSDNPDQFSVDGRATPLTKDIFVEVDWMSGHRMENAARWKVGTRFLNNPTGEEIWLHMDDGNMGGGESIEHKDTLSEYDFTDDLYNSNYNSDTGFTQSRKGKFHYCVFADEIWTGRSGYCYGDKFVVADGHEWIGDMDTTAQAAGIHREN